MNNLRPSYHSLLLLLLSFTLSFNSLACDNEAFGFLLGNPVPRDFKNVDELMLKGGSGSGNVIHSVLAEVPSPFEDFDKYVFWSNRDMKVVYAITAYRKQIKEKGSSIYDDSNRAKLKEETKLELSRLKKIFEQKDNLKFRSVTPSELTWEAETPEIRSTIGAYLGEFIYIECANRKLEEKAKKEAWKYIIR